MNLGNVLILGDSYSTFEGIIPEGYNSWYHKEPTHQTDVIKPEQTWWMQLIDCTESNLVLNDSFSGTTICHTGWTGDCIHNSFITRFEKLVKEDFFVENKVDKVIVFGGTNDNWAGSPIGEYKHSDWTKEDLYSFLPAVSYLIHRIKTVLPNAQVVLVINTELKDEVVNGIKENCKYHSVGCIELRDISKQEGHPDLLGMTQIKDQILQYFKGIG